MYAKTCIVSTLTFSFKTLMWLNTKPAVQFWKLWNSLRIREPSKNHKWLSPQIVGGGEANASSGVPRRWKLPTGIYQVGCLCCTAKCPRCLSRLWDWMPKVIHYTRIKLLRDLSKAWLMPSGAYRRGKDWHNCLIMNITVQGLNCHEHWHWWYHKSRWLCSI